MAWHRAALQDSLAVLWPGLVVEVQAQCGSTNSVLLERAQLLGAALPPTLLVAEEQTHGRGRLGRPWQASVGASLTFSLALELVGADWSGLSLAVGLALAEALEPTPAGAPRVGLKWPNDLWLNSAGSGRKLAGILIETRQAGPRRVAVIGVGLNVLPQPALGPSADSACWQELLALQGLDGSASGDVCSVPAALTRLAAPLLRALLLFQTQGFAPLVPAFALRDVLRGRAVSTTSPDGIQAVAEGVDAQGALCLRTATGLQRLVSGEVSVRLAANRVAAA